MAQYEASEYCGRASRAGQILLASSTQTASGTGTAVVDMGEWSVICWQLDLTAAASASGDTLDAYVQTTIDGTNWLDIVHFTQILGNGGTKRFIAKTVAWLAESSYSVATALSGGSVRNIFGNQYRAAWTIASASAPSFTFSVTANLG